MNEVERKFLVKYLPEDYEKNSHKELSQGYISTEPVIRIRREDDSYVLTVKSYGKLSRQEYELELSKDEFDNLSNKVEGNIISKTRYIIPIENNLKIELDVFHNKFEGLIYAEVEFGSIEEAKAFKPLDFMGEDVTEKDGYSNSSLSRMTDDEITTFLKSI